jgi:hypothetical protein
LVIATAQSPAREARALPGFMRLFFIYRKWLTMDDCQFTSPEMSIYRALKFLMATNPFAAQDSK